MIVLMFCPGTVMGQVTDLSRGDDVAIRTNGLEAVFIEEGRPDCLVVGWEHSVWARLIELKDVESLTKHQSRTHDRSAEHGFGIGFFAGAFVGMAVGWYLGEDDPWLDRSVAVPLFGLVGAVVGGLVGRAIGRSMSGVDEEPADPDESSARLEVGHQRVSLTMGF